MQPLNNALHKFESPLPVVKLKRQTHDNIDDDYLTEKDEFAPRKFPAANFPIFYAITVSSSKSVEMNFLRSDVMTFHVASDEHGRMRQLKYSSSDQTHQSRN